MMYQRILRALEPAPPEYVTVPLSPKDRSDAGLRLSVAIAEWNVMWEAGQFRRRIFDEEELPAPLREIADRGDVYVVFVPKTSSRYYEYAPLFHLLPRATAERCGLPLVRAGIESSWISPPPSGIARAWRWHGPN